MDRSRVSPCGLGRSAVAGHVDRALPGDRHEPDRMDPLLPAAAPAARAVRRRKAAGTRDLVLACARVNLGAADLAARPASPDREVPRYRTASPRGHLALPRGRLAVAGGHAGGPSQEQETRDKGLE